VCSAVTQQIAAIALCSHLAFRTMPLSPEKNACFNALRWRVLRARPGEGLRGFMPPRPVVNAMIGHLMGSLSQANIAALALDREAEVDCIGPAVLAALWVPSAAAAPAALPALAAVAAAPAAPAAPPAPLPAESHGFRNKVKNKFLTLERPRLQAAFGAVWRSEGCKEFGMLENTSVPYLYCAGLVRGSIEESRSIDSHGRFCFVPNEPSAIDELKPDDLQAQPFKFGSKAKAVAFATNLGAKLGALMATSQGGLAESLFVESARAAKLSLPCAKRLAPSLSSRAWSRSRVAGCHRRRGRKKGFRKYSATQLKLTLGNHIWKGAWSLRHSEPKNFLMGSMRNISKAVAIARTTLQDQVKRDKLNYFKGKARSGLCQYCHQWDTHEKSILANFQLKLTTFLKEQDTAFFDKWDTHENADRDFAASAAHFDNFASPRYWDELLEYCKKTASTKSHASGVFVTNCMAEFFLADGLASTVDGIQTHLRAWRHQAQEFRKQLEQPEPNTLYVAADFAEPFAAPETPPPPNSKS
jgi:hypothetical protein